MRKLNSRMIFAVTILGMLTILTVSGGIYFSGTINTSLQNLENSPVIFHMNAENNVQQWNYTWGGKWDDMGNGIAIDTSGFIYCVGETWGFVSANENFALVKLAPNGTKLWNVTWGGGNTDIGRGVAVDANGSIYCIGDTNSYGAGNNDFALVKFAPNGTKLWNATWGGTGSDGGTSVATSTDGSVYCLGATVNFGAGSSDFALVKFAPNGTKLWNVTWGGAGFEGGRSVAVATDGSIYCLGETSSFGAGSGDLALVKFAPTSTILWNVTWGGTDTDSGFGVAVDASGSIFCTGITRSFGAGNEELALVKFASTGTKLWNVTWGTPGRETGYGIAIDLSGSIYCSGHCSDITMTDIDWGLVKFTSTGTKLWNLSWGGAEDDQSLGVAVDASGAIYCTGWTQSFGATAPAYKDLVVVKFSSPPGGPGGEIPSFELLYLLIGLLALFGFGQRRRLSRPTS